MKILLNNKIIENFKKLIKPVCLFYAVVASFLVANFPTVKFAYALNISRDNAVLMRGFIFFIAIIILFYFTFKNFYKLKEYLLWDVFFRSVAVFLFLAILVSTLRATYMGEVYANISLSPFDQDVGFFYRRILEPAVAFFLQLKGQFLYSCLHFLITFSSIYMIILWLEKKVLVNFKIWQLVSIMTAGMIIHQFEAPGYPDQIILLLALLSFFVPLNKYGRISLLALMFLSHESAALFLGFIFSWFYFPKEERWYYFLLPVSYYFLWLVNYDFNFTNLFLGHLSLTNENAITLFFKNINLAVLSVFFAYKFLWILVFIGCYFYFKEKNYKLFYQIIVMVFAPLALVIVPDTSRVVAWGNIGVFLAIACSSKHLSARAFNLILVLNLLLPSVAVGTASGGAVSYAGLYGFVIYLFKLLVKNYLM